MEMFTMFADMFSYQFIVRTLIAGSLISLCASLLGVTLVLKRFSMIGDGLSHVGFGALAIALALNLSPLVVSLPVTVLAAFLLLRISSSGKIKGDAAIALISSSALAIGITVTTLTSGLNTDVYSFLFGSILSMSKVDVYISVTLSFTVLFLYLIFFNQIFAVTFDENFARACGIKAERYNMLTAILTALTVVIGMRLMGAMMISSLIIFPALTSMRVFKSYKKTVLSSVILSVICFFTGIFISFATGTPTGATIVLVNLTAFIIFSVIGKLLK